MLRYRVGPNASDSSEMSQPKSTVPVVSNTGNQARARIVQQQRRSQRTSRTWMMNKR